MEDDSDRHFGQNCGENHSCHKSLHDDPDFDPAHRWSGQEKHIYDATLGGLGHHVGSRAFCERSLHFHHVLRTREDSQWNSLARAWPNQRLSVHVHVVSGVQLLPAIENREDEQKNGSLRKAVQLQTSVRKHRQNNISYLTIKQTNAIVDVSLRLITEIDRRKVDLSVQLRRCYRTSTQYALRARE